MSQIISTEKAPAAVGPYSQAVKSGSLLFCSGQIGMEPATGALVAGGVVEEAKQALENVKAILTEAGLGFDQVVKTTCFLKDIADFAAFNEVYASYFPGSKPARSCVQATLPKGAHVEVEVIAEFPQE